MQRAHCAAAYTRSLFTRDTFTVSRVDFGERPPILFMSLSRDGGERVTRRSPETKSDRFLFQLRLHRNSSGACLQSPSAGAVKHVDSRRHTHTHPPPPPTIIAAPSRHSTHRAGCHGVETHVRAPKPDLSPNACGEEHQWSHDMKCVRKNIACICFNT